MKNTPEISIIIPAYQSQDFIYDNLIEICKILDKLYKKYEVICVVDGATDNTLIQVNRIAKQSEKVKVLNYKNNRGKGYAVRYGMEKASGELIGFIDAGRDLDYGDIRGLLKLFKSRNADIVVGSKRHPDSVVNSSFLRKIYSYGYQFYVKCFFGLDVSDTQAGMKVFKNNIIKKILPVLLTDGFAFDVEILSIAHKIHNAKIVEAPIHANLAENTSTIKIKGGFLCNSLKVFWDTLKIYYRLNVSGIYKKRYF